MEAYGLTGSPLGHSVSPEIHRRIFELESIPHTYELYAITPEEWDAHLPKLLSLQGFNVTIPHKRRILPSLDRLHASAAFYGAVNTVKRMSDGTHIGYNTDCDGFLHAIESSSISISGRVCVLGAGGVGRMFVLECARQGASVTVAVRESGKDKALTLVQEAREKLDVAVEIADISALSGAYDLLINATPVGMYPHKDACPISEETVCECRAVFDSIYNPVETKLLRLAKKYGAKTAGGTAMLVWQAVAAHEYWHNSSIEKEAIIAMIPKIEAYISEQFGA